MDKEAKDALRNTNLYKVSASILAAHRSVVGIIRRDPPPGSDVDAAEAVAHVTIAAVAVALGIDSVITRDMLDYNVGLLTDAEYLARDPEVAQARASEVVE